LKFNDRRTADNAMIKSLVILENPFAGEKRSGKSDLAE
jgi:hypothetical protein